MSGAFLLLIIRMFFLNFYLNLIGETMYSEQRPWGSFTILEEKENYKIKRIEVEPGQKLSYQSHKKRDELWMIVEGAAVITINDTETEKKYGGFVTIKKEQKHRIENRGMEKVVFIEIQTGDYFGEDDIVRYEDDYSRI
jgi:mannose-6-phosphate isomerase-like protein (cupin superfamily)